MRYSVDDVRSSPLAAAVFVVGVAVAVIAFLTADGEFGAPTGTLPWWLGVGAAGAALLATLARAMRR
ncbi:hypothetical protein [Halorarius litoreus]|uniref:hypothetical protein n=1 Tax=Halorarius litoreus TaxID=2962676 RepID=UPI0020CC4ABC|nr:hypothetical protein [Halorarius litoreus]